MKTMTGILLAVVGAATTTFGQGTILWDESVNGPFSEDSASPTVLSPLVVGTNSLIGVSELIPSPPIWISHPNFFTVQVPSGMTIKAVYLQVDKPKLWAWIGDTGYSSELAFIQNPANGELLGQWGLPIVSAGGFGMYLENHDTQPIASLASFRLDFVTQSVPEPGTLSLLLVGLGLVAFRAWKKLRLTSW